MSPVERDRELVAHVTGALNRDLERLDPAMRARLAAARDLALEQANARSGRPLAWTLTALASSAVVVLAIVLSRDGLERLPVAGLEDLELLSSLDGLDLYEDLDFYEWLETEPTG